MNDRLIAAIQNEIDAARKRRDTAPLNLPGTMADRKHHEVIGYIRGLEVALGLLVNDDE